MSDTIEAFKTAGLIVGPLGFAYGLYQKIRADRMVGRGEAPFLRLRKIELKGGPERDDRWGTEHAEKTLTDYKESWIGPAFTIPKNYPSDWPVVLRCSNEGEAVRCFDIRKKPSGFRVEVDVHDLLPIGDDVLRVHFNHRSRFKQTQRFGFRFETQKGRIGYQEYKFDRFLLTLERVVAR